MFFFTYGALSDESMVLYFAVRITYWSVSRRTRNYILLSHLRLVKRRESNARSYIPQEQDDPVLTAGTVENQHEFTLVDIGMHGSEGNLS
jgi:hypothetical protein